MGLVEKLIDQAKNPRGFIGKKMVAIMNSAHSKMFKWALSKIKIQDQLIVLDVGCGGGKTIQMISELIQHGTIYVIDYSQDSVDASINLNLKL